MSSIFVVRWLPFSFLKSKKTEKQPRHLLPPLKKISSDRSTLFSNPNALKQKKKNNQNVLRDLWQNDSFDSQCTRQTSVRREKVATLSFVFVSRRNLSENVKLAFSLSPFCGLTGGLGVPWGFQTLPQKTSECSGQNKYVHCTLPMFHPLLI